MTNNNEPFFTKEKFSILELNATVNVYICKKCKKEIEKQLIKEDPQNSTNTFRYICLSCGQELIEKEKYVEYIIDFDDLTCPICKEHIQEPDIESSILVCNDNITEREKVFVMCKNCNTIFHVQYSPVN